MTNSQTNVTYDIPEYSGDCILWTGYIDKDGYGKDGNKSAHRVAFEKAGNILIKGMEIDHLCRNRACINPQHLEQVTHKVNTLIGNTITAKNRLVSHCRNGHEYNNNNTYLSPDNERHCRVCNLSAVKQYKERAKQL